jgi:ABC-type branched-subunit amino acid transport system ATPase component
MTEVILEAEGLNTYYGKSHILHGVRLKVEKGEIVTLLGRNGAGKTTTLRSLMGLTPARTGLVRAGSYRLGPCLQYGDDTLAAISYCRPGRGLRAGRPAHLC